MFCDIFGTGIHNPLYAKPLRCDAFSTGDGGETWLLLPVATELGAVEGSSLVSIDLMKAASASHICWKIFVECSCMS